MLRSLDSNIRAFVKFKNSSERKVEVNWINFRGEIIHYTNLEPGQHYNVTSSHCNFLSKKFSLFSFHQRSTHSVLILGLSFVRWAEKDFKLTKKKFSILKLGSSSLIRLQMVWWPLDDKRRSFNFHFSHYLIFVFGEFFSWFKQKTIFTHLIFQIHSKLICFKFVVDRKDFQKMTTKGKKVLEMI